MNLQNLECYEKLLISILQMEKGRSNVKKDTCRDTTDRLCITIDPARHIRIHIEGLIISQAAHVCAN